MSVMFICSNVSLRFSVSPLISHLNDLSIAESRVLKFPTIIEHLSTSPFRSIFAWYIQVLLCCLCVFLIVTFWWIDPFIIILGWPKSLFEFICKMEYSDFISCFRIWPKFCFVWFKYSYPWVSFGFCLQRVSFSITSHSVYMCS